MHELAVCQALLERVEAIAAARGARAVNRVTVRVGPLSGVEPQLLASAFSVARAGTRAAAARLELEHGAVRVACSACGAESEAPPSCLLCAACGSYRTRVIAGDELLLASLELEIPDRDERPGVTRTNEEHDHV